MLYTFKCRTEIIILILFYINLFYLFVLKTWMNIQGEIIKWILEGGK